MLLLDDINKMAHGAGLSSSDLRVKQLAKAAYDLGMQHEREACAELAEKQRYDMNISLTSYPAQNKTAVQIANAIRERGKP